MKKLLTVMIILSVSIALFALDLNIGIDPLHNYDATATVSLYFDRLEVGGGVYTNAVGNAIAILADSKITSSFGDKIKDSFKTAEYGAMGHVYFDIIKSEFKFAIGGIAELGSIANLKEKYENKTINMNLLASAKATYLFKDTIGMFAQAGVPVATYSFSDSKFESLVQGSGKEILDYVKDFGRIQVGIVLSI